jgi:hypothetical protein
MALQVAPFPGVSTPLAYIPEELREALVGDCYGTGEGRIGLRERGRKRSRNESIPI